jgi:hypothetical protein
MFMRSAALNLVFPAYRLIEEASHRHRGVLRAATRPPRRVAAFHAGALARGVEVEEHTPDDSDVAYWHFTSERAARFYVRFVMSVSSRAGTKPLMLHVAASW